MKWLKAIMAALALALAAWLVWDRVFLTDERRLQKLIASMARWAEQDQLVRLQATITADYADEYGFDKRTLLATVRSAHEQYDQILIHISNLKITIAADRQTAQATGTVKILARSTGSATATEIRTEHPRLHFRQADRDWKLYRTEIPELKADRP